ncbi:jg11068 [Pararge aegeria aegeria]|uniref:Jg11068 protein n=1 Tax=Pararge aegeria aegeria TaxID=348720 RepID=A0A8S4R734_9NEOP|nr:jg11068 [Pararge aegeria aegeria]
MDKNVNYNMKMNSKKCLKIQNELVDNLNVAFNLKNTVIVLWNKYQILLLDAEELDRPITLQNFHIVSQNTDFEIHQLIVAKHLLCIDNEGNLFAYSLNIKPTAAAHKRSRHNFQELEHNILRVEWYEDLLFSLQLEMGKLYLRIDEIKPNDNVFLTLKSISKNNIVNINVLHLLSVKKMDKCILYCYRLNESDFDNIKHIFKEKKRLSQPQFIIIISFDKLTLYAVLVDLESNGKTLAPVKILTCPSDIYSVTAMKENVLNLIISLTSGTVIKQPMNINFNTPNIAHLNTAIHKLILLNDEIIYSDGITMWVSTNTFSESDAKLRQLFARCIKDFTYTDGTGKMVCTTYSKLLYTFHIKDESCYLFPITASDYYSAEHLFNNMTYLHRIMEEVEKNDGIIKDIKKEENYITTLALANRQDIMNEIIKTGVQVYENYEDILKEGLILNLTNNLSEYFDRHSLYFLIRMAADTPNNHDVLENIFTDSKIYVAILSEHKNIKTICIKVFCDQLQTFNIAVPLRMAKLNITDLCFDIKIVKKIPKVLDSRQNLWTALYSKQVTLTAEHFIKTNFTSDTVRLLKEPEDSIQQLLYKTCYKQYGHLFRITKVSEDFLQWSFYIKLQNTFKEVLQNEMFYKAHFNATKAKFLLKEISSEEFLNSRKHISLMVANEKLDIEILNDGFSNPLSRSMIKVSCANPLIALCLRNFFSNLVNNNFSRHNPGQEYFNLFKEISTLEQIEKGLKKCVEERLPFKDFFKLYEQFQISLCETLV